MDAHAAKKRIDHIQLYYKCEWRNPERIANEIVYIMNCSLAVINYIKV